MPNTELGHIEIHGEDAEALGRRSACARPRSLSWKKWAQARRQVPGLRLERYLWPDLVIIGGGVSKKSEKFLPSPVGCARRSCRPSCENEAGIVGAALAYEHAMRRSGEKRWLD